MKKKILALIVAACLILTGLSAVLAEEGDFWTVSYTTYDVTYDAILKMYLKVINGYGNKNTGRHDLFNQIMFWEAPDEMTDREKISYVKRNVGYYIDDINHDGIEELVINATGGMIYEVFTMDNGKVRELIRGGGRYSCRRLNNDTFYRFASGGAAYHDYEIWQMNGSGKVSFVEGYHHRPDNVNLTEVWFYSKAPAKYQNESAFIPVSADEAESWYMRQEENCVRKRFVPFIAYEKFADDPWDLGVLAKDNKTSTSAKIKIRKEPDQSSKVIMTQKVGTYVKILEKVDGYYKIRIGKKEGYVLEEYLIPVTWEEDPEPVG